MNLDVAVVVGMPLALGVAHRRALRADRLAMTVAATANAASFLLPTSNITTLLLLRRSPLPTPAYIADSWLPWLLVTSLTVGALSIWLGRPGRGEAQAVEAGPSVRAVVDLVPMYLAASGIRALVGSGVEFHGPFVEQVATGCALASAINNLPAAAAVRAAGASGLWAALLAMTIGPNLFITGSVATLICRRIARDGGAKLSAWRFSGLGVALAPVQLAVAALGLRISGVLR